MKVLSAFIASCACCAMIAPATVSAESFPKLPKIKAPKIKAPKVKLPKVPKMPKVDVPGMPKVPGVPSVAGDPSKAVSGMSSTKLDGDAYMQDVMLVARGIDLMGVGDTPENDMRIDADIETYVATINRLVEDEYVGVDPHMKSSLTRQMKQYFEKQAADVPGDIDWFKRIVFNYGLDDPETGRRMFNWLSVKRADFRAGDALFPGTTIYSTASKQLEDFIGAATTRENSMKALLDRAGVEAERVFMPAASSNDPGLKKMFRTAYATSGIDWEIMQINPTGGWSAKLNAAGRKLGDLHSAGIAARSPKNPDRCRLYFFTLIKDNAGAVRRNTHSSQMIACKNVK